MNAQNLCRNPLKEGNTWVWLLYIQLAKYLEWRDIRTYPGQTTSLRNWVETEYVNSNRYKLDSSISSKGRLLLSALRLPDHLLLHADINALVSNSTLPDTFMVWCFSTEQLCLPMQLHQSLCTIERHVPRYGSKLLKTLWITTKPFSSWCLWYFDTMILWY